METRETRETKPVERHLDLGQRKKAKKEEKEAPANERLPQPEDDLKKLTEKLVSASEKYEEAQTEENEEVDDLERIPLRDKRIDRLRDLIMVLGEINRRLNHVISK